MLKRYIFADINIGVRMKETVFVLRNREKWRKMEVREGLGTDCLAGNFAQLSDDLAYARTFYPDSDVEAYLNRLTGEYLEGINSGRRATRKRWWSFWTEELPLLLAAERQRLWLAFFFFLISVGIGVFSAAREESFVRLILGDGYVNMTLKNIADEKPMGVYAEGDAWEMFFAITFNNIRVAFVAFVFGLLCSAGTLWVLFQNGVMLGVFQFFFFRRGLLLHSALSVWAHGTFEITAIIVAGGAGLVMGHYLLFPGTYPRSVSFRRGAMRGIKIVAGLVPFFVLAGWIESFVTRYADAMPMVGAVAIGVSLVGVVGYFIAYPWYLNSKGLRYGET